jgi:hypothetical protein
MNGGGAFVYQQQVPGARYQFGGSLPASPSSERSLHHANAFSRRPVSLRRGGSQPHLDPPSILRDDHATWTHADAALPSYSMSSSSVQSGPGVPWYAADIGHSRELASGDPRLTSWMPYCGDAIELDSSDAGIWDKEGSPEDRDDDLSAQSKRLSSTLSVRAKPYVYQGTPSSAHGQPTSSSYLQYE